MRRVALLTAAALLGAAPGSLRAQTCSPAAPIPTGSCTVATSTSITIVKVLKLTLSTISQTLAAPTETNFDSGHEDASGPVVTVQTNAAWNLSINAAAATWTATGAGARASKPASDLQWSKVSGSGYAGLSASAAAVTAGTGTAGSTVNLFYRVLYNWTLDTPGNYSLVVVYTLTTP